MNKSEDAKEYEVSFLAKDEKDATVIKETINKAVSEVVTEGPISRTALAYSIQGQESAFFGYVHVIMEPAVAKQLENSLKMDTPAMRFLILTPPPGKASSESDRKGSAYGADQSKTAPATPGKPKSPRQSSVLSNEDLEKKIEEILN